MENKYLKEINDFIETRRLFKTVRTVEFVSQTTEIILFCSTLFLGLLISIILKPLGVFFVSISLMILLFQLVKLFGVFNYKHLKELKKYHMDYSFDFLKIYNNNDLEKCVKSFKDLSKEKRKLFRYYGEEENERYQEIMFESFLNENLEKKHTKDFEEFKLLFVGIKESRLLKEFKKEKLKDVLKLYLLNASAKTIFNNKNEIVDYIENSLSDYEEKMELINIVEKQIKKLNLKIESSRKINSIKESKIKVSYYERIINFLKEIFSSKNKKDEFEIKADKIKSKKKKKSVVTSI